jgi:tetratricopeptide (TPR) repeat protein
MRIGLLLICLLARAAFAFQIPDVHGGIAGPATGAILECRFDSALRMTDSAYLSGGNPLAAALHLAALGMRDVDFDSTIDAAAFARSYERALAAVDEYERARGVSAYSATLRGLVLGMRAAFHLRGGAYFAAAGSGMDAIRVMREARALDTANAEVDFFLGMYDYARADLKKRLWWVLFWYPGDRESGVRQLERGAAAAVVTKAAAALALSDIYLKEGQPQKSREIIYALRREMPRSRFVLWAEAKYYDDRKMYSRAAIVYGRLADSYEKEAYGSYNSAVTRSRQAHAYSRAGDTALAVSACGRVIERGGGGRAGGLVRDAEKLLERLLK